MMIRPTLFLHFHLAEAAYTDENIAEIKRSYSHVGPSTIDMRTGEGESPIRGSILTVDVRARGAYWDRSDAEAQAAWEQVMAKSLQNVFAKLSAAMTGLNGVHNEHRENGIYFSWIELDFHDNPHIMLHLNEDSSVERDAFPFVDLARNLCNDGAFGDDVRIIYVPAPEAFNSQEDQVKEELAEAAAAAEAQAAEEQAEANAEADGTADGQDSPAVVAYADAPADDAQIAGEAQEEQPEEPFVDTAAPVAFDIDFSIWGIEDGSGKRRTFPLPER